MIILNQEQGTPEWREARRGVLSASSFHKLITSAGKPSSQAQGLISEVILGKYYDKYPDIVTTPAMQHGIDLEPEARNCFEFMHDAEVKETGFILHDSGKYGCSPDGLIGDDSGLEIKCPTDSVMLGYERNPKTLVSKYIQQVTGCMMVTNRKSWYLFAYSELIAPVCIKINLDEEYAGLLETEIIKAHNEVVNYKESKK
jgi:hypothetical protein